MEDKQVKRDIYISMLRERRNSMAQAGNARLCSRWKFFGQCHICHISHICHMGSLFSLETSPNRRDVSVILIFFNGENHRFSTGLMTRIYGPAQGDGLTARLCSYGGALGPPSPGFAVDPLGFVGICHYILRYAK